MPADTGISTNRIEQPIPDLFVPAERIRHFAEIDLGTLDYLPAGRHDLIAISIRMEAAFDTLCKSVLELIAQDFEEIRRGALETVTNELALAFIERYGLLALMSPDLLRVLWAADCRHRSIDALLCTTIYMDMRTLARKRLGDRKPDSCSRSRHQRDFPSKS